MSTPNTQLPTDPTPASPTTDPIAVPDRTPTDRAPDRTPTDRAPATFTYRNTERLRNLIDEFNAAFADSRRR